MRKFVKNCAVIIAVAGLMGIMASTVMAGAFGMRMLVAGRPR